MTSRELVYADENEAAHLDGEPLINDTAMEKLNGLLAAQRDYDDAKTLHASEITELDERISALTTRREQLEAERTRAVSHQSSQIRMFSYDLTNILKEKKEGIDPLYAAALLAPGLDQGNWWAPKTLAIADRLGRNLVRLNQMLVSATEALPVATVRGYRGVRGAELSNLHIDYGFTQHGKGLTPRVAQVKAGGYSCGAPYHEARPAVQLPMVEATLSAVEMLHWNYTTSGGKRVLMREGQREEELTSWGIPKIEPPAIALATGTLFDDRYLLALYDKGDENVELRGPVKFGSGTWAVCAIGERAVKKVLLDYHELAVDSQQQPDLIKDMSLFVTSSLGVIIKKSEFKRVRKAKQAQPA